MRLAILHSLPILDATLDSVTLSWLVGGIVASLVLIVLGVLATGPVRRRAHIAALAKPTEAMAIATPVPVAAVPSAPPVSLSEAPVASVASVAAVAPSPSDVTPVATVPELTAANVPAPAPQPIEDPTISSPSTAPMPASVPDSILVSSALDAPIASVAPPFAPASSQAAIPIPVGPDFSASGPLMLPSSVVAATFGAAEAAGLITTGPLMPTVDAAPAQEVAAPPAASVSGPLIPPAASEPAAPTVPAVPFVVSPAPKPAPAPTVPTHAANGFTPAERVPLPDAVDLFAHSFGRSNAAMLSATERGAASRIARALRDDPLAVQLAGMYAAQTRRPLDGLAQALEADRRNHFDRAGGGHVISAAGALDVFAHSYGRSNAAMLSATERGAASRIVRALGDDPLAVRLAGQFAADTRHPLDRLANRLETDLRHVAGRSGHHRHDAGHSTA